MIRVFYSIFGVELFLIGYNLGVNFKIFLELRYFLLEKWFSGLLLAVASDGTKVTDSSRCLLLLMAP